MKDRREGQGSGERKEGKREKEDFRCSYPLLVILPGSYFLWSWIQSAGNITCLQGSRWSRNIMKFISLDLSGFENSSINTRVLKKS